METDLKSKQDKMVKIEAEMLRMERHSRSYNLRFGGIEERESEDPKQLVLDILKHDLNLDEITIENAHRTGKIKKGEIQRPRHIIVKFVFRTQRTIVIRKAKAMKVKTFYVMEDLPAADIQKKNELKDVMSKAFKEYMIVHTY
ncbi:uncharacterized protein LOC117114706 [Anneissia japonica]|uniref:uncharacterized protein LOC117114706 n=1 Tax=Anneissia japonica TaxID=1529436 RepID=UPI0014258239|nr:uncharacterized protein LOC117114706 [Anneissia japonica]